MQRIQSLVEKLNTQVQQNSSLEQLLATVQMLQKEITGGIKETSVLGTNGVSVMVPNVPCITPKTNSLDIEPANQNGDKEYYSLIVDENDTNIDDDLDTSNNLPQYEEIVEMSNKKHFKNTSKKNLDQTTLNFDNQYDVINDIPTLAQQVKNKNTYVNGNSRVKVKDLKKAITDSIKQKYLKHLFRGDEDMYERSIKTINNFTILAEAEYWIKRELKTKVGWLADDPVVQEFDELIRSRFA